MHAPDDNTTPLQSLMRLTMLPWEYCHLRAVASVCFAAGGFTLAFGLVLPLSVVTRKLAKIGADATGWQRGSWWVRRCNSLAAIWR